MIPYSWMLDARQRIAAHIKHTPLTYDKDLDLYIKWENHQITGSFKARGALNKVLNMPDWELARGLVTASAGNHGQGVALAGQIVGARVTVFASKDTVPAKLEAMRDLGAELQLVSGGFGEAEKAGLTFAATSGGAWISPYNDGQVIAGQATIAIEVYEELQGRSQLTWVVPASGGGLLAGIAAYLKAPETGSVGTSVIAVQSETSPFLHGLYHHGTQQDLVELPTIADGLAGPVEPGSITVPIVRKAVDDFLLVREDEIARGIKFAWKKYGERIEGSGAVGFAALLGEQIQERPVVLIVSGGNIQPDLHQRIVEGKWHPDELNLQETRGDI